MTDAEIFRRLGPYFDESKKLNQIVTVFILTHFRPTLVVQMIESVLSQTYTNFFLIVLDNGSSSVSEEPISRFDDPRLIYLERPSCATGNFIFANHIVRTKYYVVFHDDDIAEAHYLEQMVAAMEKNDDLSVLTCSQRLIGPAGEFLSDDNSLCSGEIVRYSGKDYFNKCFVTMNHHVSFPTAIYRKSAYPTMEKYVNERAGLCFDQYIWLETERRGGTIGKLYSTLYRYRIHTSKDAVIAWPILLPKLFHFLMEDEYYSALLSEHLPDILPVYRRSLSLLLAGYRRRVHTKKQIREAYSYMPRILRNISNGGLTYLCFRAATLFPGVASWFYGLRHPNRGRDA